MRRLTRGHLVLEKAPDLHRNSIISITTRNVSDGVITPRLRLGLHILEYFISVFALTVVATTSCVEICDLVLFGPPVEPERNIVAEILVAQFS